MKYNINNEEEDDKEEKKKNNAKYKEDEKIGKKRTVWSTTFRAELCLCCVCFVFLLSLCL
jgi:hypothetical protein